MSKKGSLSVKFLKSMCLFNVKPSVKAINTKNQWFNYDLYGTVIFVEWKSTLSYF